MNPFTAKFSVIFYIEIVELLYNMKFKEGLTERHTLSKKKMQFVQKVYGAMDTKT